MNMNMKKIYVLFLLINVIKMFDLSAGVRDIDGTTSVQYIDYNQVFPKGDSLSRGFVRFNDGITIADGAHLVFDSLMSVSAGIDIRETGTLDLLTDMYCDTHFTLSTASTTINMGYIKSRGSTIFLNGDLSVQGTIVIDGDSQTNILAIDGQGGTLAFSNDVQLLLNPWSKLILKNMRLDLSSGLLPGMPPIISVRAAGNTGLAANVGQLILNNVVITGDGEFVLWDTPLHIEGRVKVSKGIRITDRSFNKNFGITGLLFDEGSSFFVYPQSSTRSISIDSLMFNNASLFTTHTGVTLKAGSLILDNAVTFSSTANTKLTNATQIGSTVTDSSFATINKVAVNFKGKHAAFAGTTGGGIGRLTIRGAQGLDSPVTVTNANFTSVSSVAWSPDNRFIVLAGSDSGGPAGKLQVYTFNGLFSLTPVGDLITDSTFSVINDVAWIRGMDGDYIIVVGIDSAGTAGQRAVYRFLRGIGLVLVAGSQVTESFYDSGGITSVDVSPINSAVIWAGYDGSDGQIDILSLDSDGGLASSNYAFLTVSFFSSIRSVQWHPTGEFFMVGGITSGTTGKVVVYPFDSGLYTIGSDIPTGGHTLSTFDDIKSVAWGIEGNNAVVVGKKASSAVGSYQLFDFDSTNLNLVGGIVDDPTATDFRSVYASIYDDSFFVTAGINGADGAASAYTINFRYDTTPQGYSNGIVLGNSPFDPLNVIVNGGARVLVDGKVLYNGN